MTTDALLRALPGLSGDCVHLTLSEVEGLFQRLASAAQCRPDALAGLTPGREALARLLILRECMHHLGFDALQADGGALAPLAAVPPIGPDKDGAAAR